MHLLVFYYYIILQLQLKCNNVISRKVNNRSMYVASLMILLANMRSNKRHLCRGANLFINSISYIHILHIKKYFFDITSAYTTKSHYKIKSQISDCESIFMCICIYIDIHT